MEVEYKEVVAFIFSEGSCFPLPCRMWNQLSCCGICGVWELEEYKDKNRFLYGESMGGAVALLLHKYDPSFWNGAVLVAPMCKAKNLSQQEIE
ncbi:hypothetical protein J1N35_010922 [Gossypium stocksii]|uniref:Serine aminopeptidase S33 domain-containing protein n=1 Tax=Gossypium stocksii TaxID=47602 RepID=A0A9D3W1A3_9ROSI|nr:hypothetical protein J1N35_010922 [Gossypium stocksii]